MLLINKVEGFFKTQNICIENLYVSLCNALNRNYKNMYAYSWNFGYISIDESKDVDTFGKRIMRSREKLIFSREENNALERYCGITPTWHDEFKFQDFLEIVKNELKNDRPVILTTDIFYCSWHPFSSIVHSPHYCMVIGIGENEFICIDETLGNKNANLRIPGNPKTVKLDFDTVKRSNYGFVTFVISPNVAEYSDDEVVYLSALKTLNGFDGISDFQFMRKLLADLDKYLNINKEIEGFKEVWSIELIRRFNYIIWNRDNYNLFLEDKKTYRGVDIKPIIDKMVNSINLWSIIRNYITRYADNPNSKFDKNVICDKLNKIITIEEGLAYEIVNAYN